MFSQFQNDKIKIVKKDSGATSPEIKASVDSKGNMIHIHVGDVPQGWVVDDGDHIDRILPGERAERYLVIDSGYKVAWQVVPERYECEVRKVTKSFLIPPSSVTYNLNGNNARVYHESTDNSNNTVTMGSKEMFESLTNTIKENILESSELISLIGEMQSNQGKPEYLKSYRSFVSSAADHMTLLAPYLPALAQLLG